MRTAIFRLPRGACNFQECSTLSIRFNLGENCYNVRSSSARSHPMRAGTPGFVEQSPHAGGDARVCRTVTPCGRGRPRTQDARGSIILHIAIILIFISPHDQGQAPRRTMSGFKVHHPHRQNIRHSRLSESTLPKWLVSWEVTGFLNR